ncbi:MAG: hypothetical protein M5U12_27065 [Verrucomicrobia bacterium]|nr:hypothetical protein [Verrucomicrobiota bacterium]
MSPTRSGGPLRTALDAASPPAPGLLEPWTFDTLAVAESTLRTQTLSADADAFLRDAQRAFSVEGRLLNFAYPTTGAVRLGLEDESKGYVILQGPTAKLSGRIPWVSSLAQITFDLRVRGSCPGGQLDLSLGETLLGSWRIESGRAEDDWVKCAVEVGAGAGLHDLTFAYTGPDAVSCEVQVDNVEFVLLRPRLRLERNEAGGWRIGVACPAHYAGPVVLETSTSLEDWVPVTLGYPERGEVAFDGPEDAQIEARFWRARVDF